MAGRTWSEDELFKLRLMCKQRASYEAMARFLGRSPAAIRGMISRLETGNGLRGKYPRVRSRGQR